MSNFEDGTLSLKKANPVDITTRGAKVVPTLEYLLSPEFGNSLPTVNPGVPCTLWNDSRILKISQ